MLPHSHATRSPGSHAEVVLQHRARAGRSRLGHVGIREDVRALTVVVLDDAFAVGEEPASTERGSRVE